MSKLVTLAGLGLAGVGLAHFVKPEVFEDITATAFPDDTEQHLYIDGAAETVLGLALAVPRTRKLGVVGLLGYGGYLAANVLKNRAA
ncbi:MAG: hypothetical protein WAM92_09980 [Mycobacterium sp.]